MFISKQAKVAPQRAELGGNDVLAPVRPAKVAPQRAELGGNDVLAPVRPAKVRLEEVNMDYGVLDDVRIYNRALLNTDVLDLYNNGGPTTIRNAVIRNAVIR